MFFWVGNHAKQKMRGERERGKERYGRYYLSSFLFLSFLIIIINTNYFDVFKKKKFPFSLSLFEFNREIVTYDIFDSLEMKCSRIFVSKINIISLFLFLFKENKRIGNMPQNVL